MRRQQASQGPQGVEAEAVFVRMLLQLDNAKVIHDASALLAWQCASEDSVYVAGSDICQRCAVPLHEDWKTVSSCTVGLLEPSAQVTRKLRRQKHV
jgi:hypothetical protein